MRFHKIFISFTFLIFSYTAFPQVFHGTQAREYIQNSHLVWIQEETGKIRSIDFEPGKTFDAAQAGENLSSLLNLPEENVFTFKKDIKDQLGIFHSRYQQYFMGIPVEGAFYIVHSRDNNLIGANGEYFEVMDLNINPGITAMRAFELATAHVGASKYYWEFDKNYIPVPELVILPVDQKSHLAYKLDIYSAEPLFRKFVYVDAHSGDILKTIDRIHNDFQPGTAVTKYEGTREIITESTDENYRLIDNVQGTAIVTYNMQHLTNYTMAVHYTDPDNYWDETSDQEDAATNAHFAAEKTFDYFYYTYGRNSFDDEGGALISYVNFGTNYMNAFWNGNVFTFGSGDNYNYSAFTSVEVVAHEITHAVTQHSAGLEYAYESGALNESFSDIFGVSVDYYVDPVSFNYILGEEFALLGNPFRNMADPKEYGDPDTYEGEYWVSGSNDNGGVHTNNGVQNYWFYLLAEGGEGINDLGNNYHIESIGIEKAAAIAYRNLTVYLTPYSQFEDARFFSIQSAIDLFGPCSEEVIAVTNAWHAVGVGEAFTQEVQADFFASRNYSCTVNAAVEFFNTSNNASAFLWDFGDGNTSTDTNPTHTYTSSGDYTVKLVAQGINYCIGTDSIAKADIIRITNGVLLVEALCQPSGSYPDQFGISNFQLNSINNSSGLSVKEGFYLDYTCEHATYLIAGHEYPVNVQSGPQQRENVYVWIDLDNNGDFSSGELIFKSINNLQHHSGFVIIPEPDVYNVPLRLRLASDHASYPVTSACGTLHFGQYEDYTVFIQPNTEAPVADFQLSDSIVSTGEIIELSDRSLNLPQTWLWQVSGGVPGDSEEQNPEVLFDTLGEYDISLKVSNSYGTDSTFRTNAVEVLPGFVTGTVSSSNSKAGILYDTGGPEGSYQNGEDLDFLIQPECAKAITISFLSVSIEESYDNLYIYDGVDETGELLLTVTGNTIPDAVTAYSGSMYIRFVSDGIINREGFKAVWRAEVPANIAVQADFSISDLNPAFYSEVQFTDLSQGNPLEWFWNFGDGNVSYEQHPSHRFSQSGQVNVSLYTSNCFRSDTITNEFTMQAMPEMDIADTMFSESLLQGEITENALIITNRSNSGDLLYEISVHERLTSKILEKSELYESDEYFTKENNQPVKTQDLLVTQSYKGYQVVIPYSSADLEWVMNRFITGYDQLTDLIPEVYEFDGGIDGYLIEEGGNDMYDGGNYLSTDLYSGIMYHDNEVTDNQAFGSSGRYFTSKQPGLFLMAADMDHVSTFSIAGNLGADGHGTVDGSVITVHQGLQTYTGFVKRVSGAGDASVNHLIIVPNANHETGHTFNTNSNFDDHTVLNLEQSDRIYYLLFSTLNGSYIPDSVIASLMETFIQLITPECNWLVADKDSGTAGTLSSVTISLLADAENLQEGFYSADIYIRSNDTLNKEFIIPYNLTVYGILSPELEVADSIFLTIKTNEIKDYELTIGNDGGGIQLEYSIEIQKGTFNEEWLEITANAEGVIEAGSSMVSMLQVDAENLGAGKYTTTLTINSNDPNRSTKQIAIVLLVLDTQISVHDNVPKDEDTPLSNIIKVYPNPVTDFLNIDLSSMEYRNVEISIVNTAGMFISSTQYDLDNEFGTISFTIADLKPGMYLLRVVGNGNTIHSIRFVKE